MTSVQERKEIEFLCRVLDSLNKTYEVGLQDFVATTSPSMMNMAADRIEEIIKRIEIKLKEEEENGKEK